MPARLSLTKVGPRTVVTEAFARSPLRLLTPRNHGSAAWVYTSSFGGGFVDGDQLELRVRVEAGARAFLTTQGATRVYRGERGCGSTLSAQVGEGSLLAVVPDPICCFSGAAFAQRTVIALEHGASLVFAETLSAGRTARGERWALRRFSSALRVEREGRPLLDEALLLDPAHGPLPERLGRFDALGTLLLSGPEVEAPAAALREAIAARPVTRGAALLESASARPGLLLVRLAATSADRLMVALRERVGFLAALLGDDPFARRA